MFGEGMFDYFANHLDEAATFNDAMTGISQQVAAAVLKAYDFSPFRKIVDVGGGHGSLLLDILKATPGAMGVVFDVPQVVSGAAYAIQASKMGDRCTAKGGDFFQAVPDGDLIVMKNIIHDWNDVKATGILKACRKAAHDGTKLLLVELVVPEGFTPHVSHILDLEMMVLCDGKERTQSEYSELLAGAGFRLTRVIATEGHFSLVESVPI